MTDENPNKREQALEEPRSAKLAYIIWEIRQELKLKDINGTIWNDALRYLEQYQDQQPDTEEMIRRIEAEKIGCAIDSAPKDGTPIILFCDGLVGMGQYLTAQITKSKKWEGWQFMSPNEQSITFKPTHWMPLPTPPSTEPNDGESK